MTQPPMQYSQRQLRRCRGTTLIEVLAGLIILGTLLVSVSIARARFLNQWAEADQRLRATKATDTLLQTWLAGSAELVPVQSEGPLPDMPGYIWRTHEIRDPEAQEVQAAVVRVEVFDTTHPNTEVNHGPVQSVDFLLHQTPPKIVLNQAR